jgi:hypothetical protein
VRRDVLGFMLLDIADKADLSEVQLVWNWDFDKTGKGLPDSELDRRLENLTY